MESRDGRKDTRFLGGSWGERRLPVKSDRLFHQNICKTPWCKHYRLHTHMYNTRNRVTKEELLVFPPLAQTITELWHPEGPCELGVVLREIGDGISEKSP